MKVQMKPLIADDKDTATVEFEYEGKIYPLKIHQYGSHRHFHASRRFAASRSSTEAEKIENYATYIASMVDGWESDSDDFFGGPFSGELVQKICANPANVWFINAIAKKLEEQEKK